VNETLNQTVAQPQVHVQAPGLAKATAKMSIRNLDFYYGPVPGAAEYQSRDRRPSRDRVHRSFGLRQVDLCCGR
jgi:hypothetical protein